MICPNCETRMRCKETKEILYSRNMRVRRYKCPACDMNTYSKEYLTTRSEWAELMTKYYRQETVL